MVVRLNHYMECYGTKTETWDAKLGSVFPFYLSAVPL